MSFGYWDSSWVQLKNHLWFWFSGRTCVALQSFGSPPQVPAWTVWVGGISLLPWAPFPLYSFPRAGLLETLQSQQPVCAWRKARSPPTSPPACLPRTAELLVASGERIYRRPRETRPFSPLTWPSCSRCLLFVWPAFLAGAQDADFLVFPHVSGCAVLGPLTLFSPSAPPWSKEGQRGRFCIHKKQRGT